MDFTNPFQGMTPSRKLTIEELMRAIRIDIAAELDAINLYQAHIDAIDDEYAKQIIAHIRDEEKEHMAEFTALLNYLDSVQKALFETEEMKEIAAGQAQMLPTSSQAGEALPGVQDSVGPVPAGEPETQQRFMNEPFVAQPSQSAPQPASFFTVGSLLGQGQEGERE